MSSDSEDDFSYTNSAKLFKNIKNKVQSTVIQNDLKNDTDNEIILEPVEPLEPEYKTNKRTRTRQIQSNTNKCKKIYNNNDSLIELDTPEVSILDSSIEIIEIKSNDNSAILETLDTSIDNYSNLLEKVSSYIDGNKRRGRGRGRGRKSKSNVTRNNEQLNDEESTLSLSNRRITRSARKRRRGSRRQADNIIPINTIVIDPDVPIINSALSIPDELNDEIIIKILWKSQKFVNFTIRKYQPLKTLFEFFSKEENIPEERLLFTINDQMITMKDTPHSLNINLTSVIEGGVLSKKTHLTSGMGYCKDAIDLKVQIKDRKQPLIITMKTTDEMKVFMFKCSEELQLPVQRLKFTFDGEIILPNNTPIGLEFEGGECIDCVIKSA